jgi:hypothetical protein
LGIGLPTFWATLQVYATKELDQHIRIASLNRQKWVFLKKGAKFAATSASAPNTGVN